MHFEAETGTGGNTHHHHMTFVLQRHFWNKYELGSRLYWYCQKILVSDQNRKTSKIWGILCENPDASQNNLLILQKSLILTV